MRNENPFHKKNFFSLHTSSLAKPLITIWNSYNNILMFQVCKTSAERCQQAATSYNEPRTKYDLFVFFFFIPLAFPQQMKCPQNLQIALWYAC